jgi:hypothetical protein
VCIHTLSVPRKILSKCKEKKKWLHRERSGTDINHIRCSKLTSRWQIGHLPDREGTQEIKEWTLSNKCFCWDCHRPTKKPDLKTWGNPCYALSFSLEGQCGLLGRDGISLKLPAQSQENWFTPEWVSDTNSQHSLCPVRILFSDTMGLRHTNSSSVFRKTDRTSKYLNSHLQWIMLP